ncbi:Ubiquitin domain-containing protein 2,Ubiquitin domain-containing protein 1 [Acanthosepion pharaonis]|uniref:Ubiquitin domain-containing protein 2,Ubiquitin domain-containing protein 1 n=1 Tax=Acanthosepion pharaonis TaxID=158019 RepID=A0A812DG17_ACAPH|nr:Ubiquitin domain-containing protein 2,Ubiquitin domain-containing protein 1 [Sepia pharaonis]
MSNYGRRIGTTQPPSTGTIRPALLQHEAQPDAKRHWPIRHPAVCRNYLRPLHASRLLFFLFFFTLFFFFLTLHLCLSIYLSLLRNYYLSIGRNQPLKPEKPKWKSDVPLTEGQLRSKRDEFWDTAPAFEGRKEIWDALKAAAYALETGDHSLAQAIVDGANISLPNGTLMDCYDELGNRYQLPVYVLSAPTNLIEEASDSDTIQDPESASPGLELPIKFRLSHSNKDLKLYVRTTDTVWKVKKRIFEEEGIDPSRQRWFFSGRLLIFCFSSYLLVFSFHSLLLLSLFFTFFYQTILLIIFSSFLDSSTFLSYLPSFLFSFNIFPPFSSFFRLFLQ